MKFITATCFDYYGYLITQYFLCWHSCTWKTAPGLAVQPKLTPMSTPDSLAVPKSDSASIPKSDLQERVLANLKAKLPQPDFSNTEDDSHAASQSQIEDDELPDLSTDKVLNEADSQKDSQNENPETQALKATEDLDLHLDASETEKVGETQDKEGKPEQDSGFLSAPQSSEEENSKGKGENDTNADVQERKDHITCTPSNKSPATSKSLLTPKLAGLKLDHVTPSLSKGADDFIDLDEDDEAGNQTPHNPGIVQLMDRLMKHSIKKPKHKERNIEMRLVDTFTLTQN